MKATMILLLMSLLFGCQPMKNAEADIIRNKNSSKQNLIPFKKIGVETWIDSFNFKDPIKRLEFFCKKAKGVFYPDIPLCQCSGENKYVGWDYGTCVEVQKKPLDKLLKVRYVAFDHEIKELSPMVVEGDLANDPNEYQSLIIPLFINGDILQITDIRSSDVSSRDIEQTLNFIHQVKIKGNPGHWRGFIPIVLGRTDKFDRYPALSLGTILNTPFKDVSKEFIPEKYKIIRDLNLKEFQKREFDSFSDRGCMFQCILSMKLKKSDLNLIWEKNIVGGQLLTNVLKIKKDGDDNSEISFVLDATNSPIYSAITNMTEVDNSLRKIYEIHHVEDGFIRNFSWTYLDNIDEEKELAHSIAQEVDQSTYGLLCDTGTLLIEAQKRGLLDKIFIPSNIQYKNSSIYGLFNLSDKNLTNKYREIIGTPASGVFHIGPHSDHSYIMLRNVEKSKFIPFNLVDCLMNSNQWMKTAKKYNASVINLSAVQFYEYRSCSESQLMNQVKETLKQGFMWVMASGNVERIYDSPTRSSDCPQSQLAGNDNALIAAADEGSSRGFQFADIFVKDRKGNRVGSTSEASILLADFVIELKNTYPELSNKNIRRSILLSSDVESSSYAYQSRAGGYLNRKRAIEIGKILQSNPNQSNENIIKKVFKEWNSCRSKCKKKLKHMREKYK